MIKQKNIQLERMMNEIKPLLPMRNKVGYIAARNTRVLSDVLADYLVFKNQLIEKYGENKSGQITLDFNSPNFKAFESEFMEIGNIEQEVNLLKINYSEVIGVLTGEEILRVEWMLIDEEEI
jgi:hypothetical protein